MKRWHVLLNDYRLDTVFSKESDAEIVRQSLVYDGYPSNILVKRG